jgi:hypothetical protein
MLADWPRSRAFMKRVATRLAEQKNSGTTPGAASYFWPGVLPRNFLFLVVVLLHGARRLLPPY